MTHQFSKKLNEFLVCFVILLRICDSITNLFIFTLFNYHVSSLLFEVAYLLYSCKFFLSSFFYNFFYCFLLDLYKSFAVLIDNFYMLSSRSCFVNYFFIFFIKNNSRLFSTTVIYYYFIFLLSIVFLYMIVYLVIVFLQPVLSTYSFIMIFF